MRKKKGRKRTKYRQVMGRSKLMVAGGDGRKRKVLRNKRRS